MENKEIRVVVQHDGFNAILTAVVSQAHVVHKTEKSTLLQGVDEYDKDRRQVQVWVPDFWILRRLEYQDSIKLLIKRKYALSLELKPVQVGE